MQTLLLTDPFIEYDVSDIFDDALQEGKSLATYKGTGEVRAALIDAGFDLGSGEFKRARRKATARSNKRFAVLHERVARGLHSMTMRFLNGEISKARWQEYVRHLLRDGYEEAFRLGFESSGATEFNAVLSAEDRRWLASAVRAEMVHFNKLLRQIVATHQRRVPERVEEVEVEVRRSLLARIVTRQETKKVKRKVKIPAKPAQLTTNSERYIRRRMMAYADTLKHVYYAGRVKGTPKGMVIDWISPLDRHTCKGCRYMAEHSPWTRDSIPTTPRAGDTRCLSNCRCRLVMREVTPEVYAQLARRTKPKTWYHRILARLFAA